VFRRLRTKLTVLYAGLFGVSLILVAAAIYAAITTNAQRAVRSELEASGTVFDRIWALRSQQLQNGAVLLSRDFGFREAVATHDAATIRSALGNLSGRLGADLAFIVGVDGSVAAADGRPVSPAAAQLLRSLDGGDNASGVFVLDGAPYEAISAPILSPTLTGWVVFANRLDAREMASLERLSAIPMKASILLRDGQGRWRGEAGPVETPALSRFVESALSARGGSHELVATDGPSIALAKPLKTLSVGSPAALVLRYPLALALAPYRMLLESVAAAGLLGFLLLLAGSWALARSVTRPISALDEAARRLQRGEDANVEVSTSDEIARLASSFNTMAAEIRERERKITHLAMHDPDTDLPNRSALEREIDPLLEFADERILMVAALGVDRFPHVRGAIGYGLASALICELGAKLRWMDPGYRIARLSTDVIGLAFIADDLEDAQAVAASTLAVLQRPIQLGDNTIDVSLTVGLAAHHLHEDLVGSLIERANIALDQARAARQKIALFDPGLYGDPAANLSLMSDMLRGVSAGEMVIHHQPKLDLRRGEITGVEALVRWRHPVRGLLAPDRFILMAEETGHIAELTEWVLGRAIEEQALLRHQGHELAMSVNFSGRLLGDLEFAETALDMVRGARGQICFEITETAVIENPDVALQVLDRFAQGGVSISIDDYGSGLSSLAYLKQIRADELKIDKAFVLQMAESQRDALLVRSTVDLAHSLGLKVTAEGVETDMALSLLAGMGCDMAQGFLIARPMPLKELLTFLAQEQSGRSLTADGASSNGTADHGADGGRPDGSLRRRAGLR
jgi:EAL domain-containing protein (putative c-di-GMP-specific phosphodiesterase class I)/GGDEF domain-containing protein